MKNLIKKIKNHEGFRSTVYQCTEGYDTIGYGFAIKDLELDKDIAELILERKLKKLQKRIASSFRWFYNSADIVKDVEPVVTKSLPADTSTNKKVSWTKPK